MTTPAPHPAEPTRPDRGTPRAADHLDDRVADRVDDHLDDRVADCVGRPHFPPPLQLEQSLGFRLGRLVRMLRAEWALELEGLGLTPPQVAVLRGVAGRPGCSLRALARTLGTDPMKVKRCVDVLERRGLIQSAHRGTDRRPRALRLAPESLALTARIDALVRAQEERLTSALGPARLSDLEGALAALEADVGLFPAADDHSALRTKGTTMTTDPSCTTLRDTGRAPAQGHRTSAHSGPAPTHAHHGQHHRAQHDGQHGTGSPGAAWDERYSGTDWPTDPDAPLVELVSALHPGRAIDLGCGPGRNAIWLARQGWRVTGVDASGVGLAQAKERATREGLVVELVHADLLSYVPSQAAFDLVVVANLHFSPEERGLFFARAVAAVAPGGHLFVTGHHLDSLGQVGPPFPERLYTEELLRELLAPLAVEVRRYERPVGDGQLAVDAVAWAAAPTATAPTASGGGR